MGVTLASFQCCGNNLHLSDYLVVGHLSHQVPWLFLYPACEVHLVPHVPLWSSCQVFHRIVAFLVGYGYWVLQVLGIEKKNNLQVDLSCRLYLSTSGHPLPEVGQVVVFLKP